MVTTSEGCVKLTTSGGVFLLRLVYLCALHPNTLQAGCAVGEDEERDIMQAAKCFEAEQMASVLLCRAEQSRQGLMRKLVKKGAQLPAVEKALDYLEEVGALSDARYARAYLNLRRTRIEGRARKAACLLHHGIGRDVADSALDEFFAEHSSEDMCRKAVQKGVEAGKHGERLCQSLVRRGFASSMVKRIMREAHNV